MREMQSTLKSLKSLQSEERKRDHKALPETEKVFQSSDSD